MKNQATIIRSNVASLPHPVDLKNLFSDFLTELFYWHTILNSTNKLKPII